VITDELDIRAANIVSEVLVVHQTIGSGLLKDARKKDSALVIDMIALADIIKV
jgi:hypothetical protein